MANDKYAHDQSCICIRCNCDEDYHENKNLNSWPFASEDEEHRHFDNLQRARDIRSS